MAYYFLPDGSETRYEIIAYDPEQNQVKCAGPVGEFIISLEVDPRTSLDCRLITEDGEDVELKEVVERLQERVRAAKEEGRVWYGV